MRYYIGFLLLICHCSSTGQLHTRYPPDSVHVSNPDPQPAGSRPQQIITVKSVIFPSACIAYGFAALRNHHLIQLNKYTIGELRTDHSHFATRADSYLQFSPAVSVYVLNNIGINGKNNALDRSMIYSLSLLISSATMYPMKRFTHERRPDLSAYNSFPSGHTTIAFASAEFLRQEYQGLSSWYGIAGYTVATATGVLRMCNDRHWLSDVVAGAGLGILSTKAAYAAYPCITRRFFREKPLNPIVMPFYQQKGGGLALICKL